MGNFSYEPKNVWKESDESLKKEIMNFSEGYKTFMATGVTERLCVEEIVKMAEKAGYRPLSDMKSLSVGDCVYAVNREKSILLAKIGKRPMAEAGLAVVAAHIDSPRLDLKPVPVIEDGGIAYFKTHYYGGIKKYQWTALPLGMSGVVMTKNGPVKIHVSGDDFCLCISDLLPHLAASQMTKPAKEVIEGENLSVIIGTIPSDDKEESLKDALLKLLNEMYGITEADFISAELEIYPAVAPKDVGFDRSLVGSYGHDDRVCAYTGLKALLDSGAGEKTAVCMLADKEEIGSMGNTGMKSRFFENTVAEMISLSEENYSDLKLRKCLSASVCLSADVCAAFDPLYAGVFEKQNTPKLNQGLAFMKYTGSRGKGGSSDASAELIYKIRNLLDEEKVFWQIGELGKVDEGGGGTVAQYIANLDLEVIDCGVPLLSMHSPFEIAAKADIYSAYKGYKVFFEKI
ncbi:MAG: aminopeptidase [Clostridia bacterium]|nr:aminopeptidase [Clostridia bacterium]